MKEMWEKAQKWESDWWGDCLDTVGEELKQQTYASKMGLSSRNLEGKTVLDIGGGVISLLLKFKNRGSCCVVDPITAPNWVHSRYKENNIRFINGKAEDISLMKLPIFDEIWIYNCLQHTEDPKKIIKNIKKLSKVIRIFEWVEEPISPGHINVLHEKQLNTWLGGEGKVEVLNDSNGCHGSAYFGVFKGDNYDN